MGQCCCETQNESRTYKCNILTWNVLNFVKVRLSSSVCVQKLWSMRTKVCLTNKIKSPSKSWLINGPVMRRTLMTTFGPVVRMSMQKQSASLLPFFTFKNGVRFDKSLGKCTLFALSKKNSSCELVATSQINAIVTTPTNLEMLEQIWFHDVVAPVTNHN